MIIRIFLLFILVDVCSLKLNSQVTELEGNLQLTDYAGEIRFVFGPVTIGKLSAFAESGLDLIAGDAYLNLSRSGGMSLIAKNRISLISNQIVLTSPGNDDGFLYSDPSQPGSDLKFVANDAVVIQIDDNNNGQGNFFVWDDDATNLFQVTQAGDIYVRGTSVHGSDLNRKENIIPINYNSVLRAIKELPVFEWQFKDQERRHIGPMAQDFHKAFGLGDDDTTIASIDIDGVTLAAVKAQQDIIEQQQREINQLRANQKAELEKLSAKNQSLQQQIDALKRIVTSSRTNLK